MPTDGYVSFIDADVLSRPVTRTLVIMASDDLGLPTIWSQLAEEQAEKHLPPSALPLADLRARLHRTLGPTGDAPGRFAGTQPSDRQILADAGAACVQYLITSDVDDFAEADLDAVGITAVHPDLYLSIRLDRGTYAGILAKLVANMNSPPRTPSEMHSLLARQHPRLFARHADVFSVKPSGTAHNEPAVLVRGRRCVRCGTAASSPAELTLGLGPECVDGR